ncbi:PHP domain-containing protein [Aliidiomarina celeris]|uniref:PHP domain-containing protein n=1 Tax=Aliidiomarina celeris TaxID=2249428 RepID=UPI000DE9EB79|nr:PHP domain-containing protein [Aliidiomarina celeris]
MKIAEKNISTPLRIDLHCHSHISDGSLAPDVLVMRAAQMQLAYLAITDHDAIAAVALARNAANTYGQGAPEIIAGVEFSCRWNGYEIHVLGWGFDPQHQAIKSRVESQQRIRRERAQAIADKLVKYGMSGADLPDMTDESRVYTRAHFAEALVQGRYVPTIEQAFRKYLGKGQCAYVATPWCDIDEAIASIHAAGGVAGLAHPLAYQMTNKWLKRLVEFFKSSGGEALEVASGQQDKQQRMQLAELARNYDLLASVGSDFHRPGRWRELGRNLQLPDYCKPVWQHTDILNETVQI